MNRPQRMPLKAWLTSLLAVSLMLPVWAWSRVGEITLVVGQFEIQRPAGPAQNLTKGDAILEGDVIKTTANGHVHIRFIDGGLVSVRPNSVFTIHEFKYNPAQPATSVVRLRLDRGEVRSISGQAAQEAKERFRLNTPLVAIGVKGTDFTTQAAQGATRVTVTQGAIVMAPFDQSCRAEALGVCTGARAKDLSADMIGMALVYRSGAADPSLQLISGQKEPGQISQLDRQMRDNTIRAVTPPSPAPDEVVPAARLVWGRWSQTPAPGDQLTISFREALQGNEVTVGDGYHFLFREPNVPNQLPSLGNQVSFKLQGSSAQYRTPANEVVAAQVNGGSFIVDFAQRSYATQLQVQANGIAPQNLQYSGKVDVQTGIFLGPTASGQGSLAGALGLDGRQAGYFFSSPIGNGSLSGATQWSR
uniref:FecR family protein n=1 Tax=Limnohabitans sp. TaxID=1907725 RepID=UPI004048BF12